MSSISSRAPDRFADRGGVKAIPSDHECLTCSITFASGTELDRHVCPDEITEAVTVTGAFGPRTHRDD